MSAQAMNKRSILAGKRERRQVLIGMAYIAPSFILMMIFNVIPIFVSLFLAFCKYNMVGTPTWIGLENFQKLFANKALREAMINTLRYVLMTVPVQTILAGRRVYRRSAAKPLWLVPAERNLYSGHHFAHRVCDGLEHHV